MSGFPTIKASLALALLTPGSSLTLAANATPNRADEPVRDEVSLAAAVEFVDAAAVNWQNKRGCVTCHTNGVYLITRSAAGVNEPAYQQTRQFARDYLETYLDEQLAEGTEQALKRIGEHGVVATAAFLAISDIQATGELAPLSRRGLDHIWTLQRENGAWTEWAKCHWGPYEVDDHYGVTLAALAVGMAPAEYRESPNARHGIERMQRYIENHPPACGHQKAMTLWASQHLPKLATDSQQAEWIDDLLALQHDDGGWATIELGDARWQRADDKPQDTHSDGFATAFVLYALRQAGVPADDVRLQAALAWLRANQRESGRWFTRSPHRDGKHYITHAGTNFAIAALLAMEEHGAR